MKQNKEPANEYQEGPGFSLSVKPPYSAGAGLRGQPDEFACLTRPLPFDMAKAVFKAAHPEFVESVSEGDWTSFKWTNKV